MTVYGETYPAIGYDHFRKYAIVWGIFDERVTEPSLRKMYSGYTKSHMMPKVTPEEWRDHLTRSKYLDFLVRVAKVKFAAEPTVYQATERLLKEHVMPNLVETMECQEFRDRHMFDVQVDDVFKSNKANIDKLWKKYAGKAKVLTLEENETMLDKAGLDLDEASVLRCFTLSRALVVDEVADRLSML